MEKPRDMLDEVFHPQNPICQIIPTCTKKKQDYFSLCRPKPHQTCLDYNISQTDTKMDAGDTKIHYKETVAEYVPCLTDKPPPKEKKVKKRKYSSGGPPQWVFVDEIWRKQQDELQKIYLKNFKIRVALRKRMDRIQMNAQHGDVVVRVGPEWYQELSPKQIRTIDTLKTCILKDLADGTTINTQENIANLGLVLRPSQRHVKKALDNCCKYPAEFLLVLYQLINPKRTKYSINDRLLLSSVVHLTMTATLKELHIRIPSPPPLPKVTKKKTKKKKVVKYESPYLVPYRFRRAPPRFSGVYSDKHVQYPQSQYFCYSKETTTETRDEEIEEELKLAQKMYEDLVDFRPVPLLLKPSRYCPCDNFRNRRLRGGGTCKHVQDLETYNKMYHLIRPNEGREKETCKCKEKYREFVEKPLCQCEKCEEDRKTKNSNFVISGLKESVRVIDRVAVQKPCTCLKKHEKVIEEYEKEKEAAARRPCDCRKDTTILARTSPCTCEKCEEDRRRKGAKYIIAGTKETQGNPRIIEGISTGKPCDCWRRYEKRAEKYEEFRKSQKAVVEMKEKDQKYIIGGVVNTPQGPVYVISGIRPPIDCACAKKARAEESERRAEARMPQVPPGRVPYQIVGVKETGDKSVYILGQTLPVEECDCMAVYEKFEEQHTTCVRLYEEYLAKMRDEYNQFMNDMLPPSECRSRRSSRVSDMLPPSDSPIKVSDVVSPIVEKEPSGQKSEPCIKPPKLCQSCRKVKSAPCCFDCQCSKPPKIECAECTCDDQVVECVDCTCGTIEEEEEEEEEIVEGKKELKRFFIFGKIKCNRKWQRKILRKALKSMADDGFPLAKLPQSYKLPHFKLWMEMRSGKFWTQQDRYDYILKSKNMWRHCHKCDIWKERMPSLKISKEEGYALDWSKADYCRKIVNDTLEKFYRKLKQNRVHFGREFLATTFTYEFPFKTWRDCYYAYTPSKEEDVTARFVWQKHDYKNFADMQRFCQ